MNYEKKYKEAFERAKKELNTCGSQDCDAARQIFRLFPELEESEDERLRNTTIAFLKDFADKGYENAVECIDWLEKQWEQKKDICEGCNNVKGCVTCVDGDNWAHYYYEDEQKPANKIEPKFHEGDWIVHQGTENIYQVVVIVYNQYQLRYGDNYTIQNCVDVDKCARLWDITKDVKNGDILVYGDNKNPFIFKRIDIFHPNCPVAYCGIGCDGTFMVCKTDNWWTDEKCYPATKKQRDTLMKAMDDAGYTFDFKKKELKEI